MLYVSGIDVADICKMPEFQATKLGAEYAHVHVNRMGWKKVRDRIKEAVKTNAIVGLQQRVALVRERFHDLYLAQVELEMRTVETQLRIATPAAQLQRLEILEKLREVATPVLGLDKQEGDPNVAGFKTIYNIQVNGNVNNLPLPEGTRTVAPPDAIEVVVVSDDSPPTEEKREEALQRIKKIKVPRYRNDNSPSPTEAILEGLKVNAAVKENEKKIPRKSDGSRTLGLPKAKSAP